MKKGKSDTQTQRCVSHWRALLRVMPWRPNHSEAVLQWGEKHSALRKSNNTDAHTEKKRAKDSGRHDLQLSWCHFEDEFDHRTGGQTRCARRVDFIPDSVTVHLHRRETTQKPSFNYAQMMKRFLRQTRFMFLLTPIPPHGNLTNMDMTEPETRETESATHQWFITLQTSLCLCLSKNMRTGSLF